MSPSKPTEPSAQGRQQPEAAVPPVLRRWGALLSVAVIAAATAGAGFFGGAGLAILVLAGSAMLLAIAAFWASLRSLAAEAPISAEQAYEMAAPSAETERKLAALRAIGDLEFERSVGKLSEADHEQWLGRVRAQAEALLVPLGKAAQPARRKAEALLAERLHALGLDGEAGSPSPRQSDPERRPERSSSERPPARKRAAAAASRSNAATEQTCSECQTPNDLDAVFCKQCGRRFEEPENGERPSEPSS